MSIFESATISRSISIDVVSLLVSGLGEKVSDHKHANWQSGFLVLETQYIVFL